MSANRLVDAVELWRGGLAGHFVALRDDPKVPVAAEDLKRLPINPQTKKFDTGITCTSRNRPIATNNVSTSVRCHFKGFCANPESQWCELKSDSAINFHRLSASLGNFRLGSIRNLALFSKR